MKRYNDPWLDIEEWFFADNECLGETHGGDGITVADQVAELGETFATWVDCDYKPAQPIVLDPLFVMDVLALESSMRRLLAPSDEQYLLLDVWKAWADCSVEAGVLANLWARGELTLALWDLVDAGVDFQGFQMYSRVLDEELAYLDSEPQEMMPPVLLEWLVAVRDGRQLMLASEADARKNQPTLFDLDEDTRLN